MTHLEAMKFAAEEKAKGSTIRSILEALRESGYRNKRHGVPTKTQVVSLISQYKRLGTPKPKKHFRSTLTGNLSLIRTIVQNSELTSDQKVSMIGMVF